MVFMFGLLQAFLLKINVYFIKSFDWNSDFFVLFNYTIYMWCKRQQNIWTHLYFI